MGLAVPARLCFVMGLMGAANCGPCGTCPPVFQIFMRNVQMDVFLNGKRGNDCWYTVIVGSGDMFVCEKCAVDVSVCV